MRLFSLPRPPSGAASSGVPASILRGTFKAPRALRPCRPGDGHEPGVLVMEIPLDLERRFEQRWVARFFSTKRIGLKGCINRMPRPAKEKCPLGLPLGITGDQWFGPRQEAEALSICSISDLAETGLVR
jgi:hypothetical protein